MLVSSGERKETRKHKALNTNTHDRGRKEEIQEISFSHFSYFCFHIKKNVSSVTSPCNFPVSLIQHIVFSNSAGLRHHFCFLLSQWIMYTEQFFLFSSKIEWMAFRIAWLTLPWDPELGSSTTTVSTEFTAITIKAKVFLFCRGQPCDTWSLREYFRPCSLRLSPVLQEALHGESWHRKKKGTAICLLLE